MGVSWRLGAVCLVPIALLEGSSVCIVKIKKKNRDTWESTFL